MPPLLSLAGDLSKVQWPAALQELDLQYCEKMKGAFQPRLASFVRPTNTIEQPLPCGPSRKPPNSSFPVVLFARVRAPSLLPIISPGHLPDDIRSKLKAYDGP